MTDEAMYYCTSAVFPIAATRAGHGRWRSSGLAHLTTCYRKGWCVLVLACRGAWPRHDVRLRSFRAL